ncbi:DALR anticodon-binding domain-containing protein [Streptomyces sp. C10-9-1]|uniref:ArgS-related anticodon-binding protein NrtL n=1 Tax=Streptomyces sp. C10-9-1 TaxID=1859285 RepID=UPI0021111D6E|nr:DALR anticodon-binding domain-containing protein [Streptomyces sp. C10-9-1]MCQ6552799.1 DALR anticodon-binding domain-containing protein [Streptomyces sp. C10-9-1]
MTPAELSRTVRHAVCRAVEDGALRVAVPETVQVERPRPGGRGHWASNVALRLAREAGRSAAEVAGILGRHLEQAPGIARVEVTGPGFLNLTLADGSQQTLVRSVLAQGPAYGLPSAAEPRAHDGELRERVWGETLARMGARPAPGERLGVVPAPDQELAARLGADAARWALLAAAAHDRPRTQGLLVQHERNPLFRVRYAHARAHALTRGARALGFAAEPVAPVDAPALTSAVADHPAAVADAARLRAPDRLARHLETVADALLSFQHTVLPVGDEKPSAAHRSRLALAEAAGAVLAGGLSLFGISAPLHL